MAILIPDWPHPASVLQILSASSVYFCTSYPALLTAVSLASLFSCMVLTPSFNLLSEICLIRSGAGKYKNNTFHTIYITF